MLERYSKIFKNIFIDGNFHRIWQILTKSPLIHVLAWAHRLRSPGIYSARKKLFQALHLSQQQTETLNLLKNQGYARVDHLFSDKDFQVLNDYLSEKQKALEQAKTQQLVQTKDFWVRLSDSDLAQGMTTEHPLVALSLKKDLLEIVTSYLGSAPFFEYVLLTHSTPSKSPLKSSQLWHQDHDNDRMIKFFVYLSDVNSIEDGPFTLLPKTANEKIKNSFFPKHLSDEAVEKDYSLAQKVEIKGQKFSAFLVDTSKCYHMGSRVLEGHSRLMSTSLFVTLPKAYWGPVKGFVKPTRVLSELEKFAVTP